MTDLLRCEMVFIKHCLSRLVPSKFKCKPPSLRANKLRIRRPKAKTLQYDLMKCNCLLLHRTSNSLLMPLILDRQVKIHRSRKYGGNGNVSMRELPGCGNDRKKLCGSQMPVRRKTEFEIDTG